MNISFNKLCVYSLTILCISLCSTPLGSAARLSRYHESLFPQSLKLISMDFKDTDLRTVLKIFSQQSGLNFITATDVSQMKVNLYLDNVPVEEALERILSANDLIYEIQPGSDIFVVKKVEKPEQFLITRVYPLKHATVSNSDLLKLFEECDDTSSSTASSGEEDEDEKELRGIYSAVRSLLTANGKIIEDARTNSLIVTDIPSQFPIIEQTILEMDVPIAQILIEVEMLDISKNTSDLLGVKYGATPLAFTGGQRDHVYPWNQNKLLSKGYVFEEAEYRVGTIDASGMSAMIQFLKTISDTKSLAHPKIMTLNNRTAELMIATDESIGVNITENSETSSTTVTAERTKTGIFLSVTPQVNPQTGEITLSVFPRVIEARQGSEIEASGGTFAFRDPEERGTRSILKVQSGETVYIGGLIRSEKIETITKLPLLGDLPFIGGAFRHKNLLEKDRELVIFITPKIITSGSLIPNRPLEPPGTTTRPSTANRSLEIEQTLLITEQKRLQR